MSVVIQLEPDSVALVGQVYEVVVDFVIVQVVPERVPVEQTYDAVAGMVVVVGVDGGVTTVVVLVVVTGGVVTTIGVGPVGVDVTVLLYTQTDSADS